MYFLIKKAVAMRKHLERNRKDREAHGAASSHLEVVGVVWV